MHKLITIFIYLQHFQILSVKSWYIITISLNRLFITMFQLKPQTSLLIIENNNTVISNFDWIHTENDTVILNFLQQMIR